MISLSFACQQAQPFPAELVTRAVASLVPASNLLREPRSLPLAVLIRREL